MKPLHIDEGKEMSFFLETMMSKTVSDLAAKTIKNERVLTEREGRIIAEDLQKILRFEPMHVRFMDSRCELVINGKDGEILGRAYPKSRAVVLWNKIIGHRVSHLLHEMAHLMEGGCGHLGPWVANYKNLIDVYNERFGDLKAF